MAGTIINTARLRLRRPVASDAEALHAILTRPEAMRYWATPPHTTIAETREWMTDMIAPASALSEEFVVEHAGAVIGKVGCWAMPEIGFIFHPVAWGRGFAREACAAVIDHVFAVHPIPAITADVDPDNGASLRLLARLGFVETGRVARTWRVGGVWTDSVYLALARPPGA